MENTINRITTNPEICGGRPCIRGLRVRVEDVLGMLAAGSSRTEILADYPYLESDDITAALEFARYVCATHALPFDTTNFDSVVS